VRDNDAAGGFGPAAIFVEAAVGADGADDVVGGCLDGLGLLNNQVEGMLRSRGALFEEAEGAGMAPDGSAVAELVFVGNHRGADPMEEVLLDCLAIGMAANSAADSMVIEVRLAAGAPVGEAAGSIGRGLHEGSAGSLA